MLQVFKNFKSMSLLVVCFFRTIFSVLPSYDVPSNHNLPGLYQLGCLSDANDEQTKDTDVSPQQGVVSSLLKPLSTDLVARGAREHCREHRSDPQRPVVRPSPQGPSSKVGRRAFEGEGRDHQLVEDLRIGSTERRPEPVRGSPWSPSHGGSEK